jgi:hypothetical protein
MRSADTSIVNRQSSIANRFSFLCSFRLAPMPVAERFELEDSVIIHPDLALRDGALEYEPELAWGIHRDPAVLHTHIVPITGEMPSSQFDLQANGRKSLQLFPPVSGNLWPRKRIFPILPTPHLRQFATPETFGLQGESHDGFGP